MRFQEERMLLVWLSVLVVLWLLQQALRLRVGRLERRYAKVATEAGATVKEMKLGNSKPDPLLAARQQYELAQLAVRRERVEKSYASWQSLCERFAAFRGRLAGYRGRAL